jgi:hypothetical protein
MLNHHEEDARQRHRGWLLRDMDNAHTIAGLTTLYESLLKSSYYSAEYDEAAEALKRNSDRINNVR